MYQGKDEDIHYAILYNVYGHELSFFLPYDMIFLKKLTVGTNCSTCQETFPQTGGAAMTKPNLNGHSVFPYAALAIILAIVLRQIGFRVEGVFEWVCSVIRSSIYIGMFSIWGVFIRRRIIQPRVRCYLTTISALMVFWVSVRTLRFLFADDPGTLRYLWYMYYLPMLFIPFLAVFVALSLGKPESSSLPKWTTFLYIPTAALLLLVLTNDLHQLVFAFPANASVWKNDYRYAMGYFLIAGWQMLCAFTALTIMLIKCRTPNSRKVLMLPFVPVILTLIYSVLYIFRVPWLKSIAGDMTVVFCLLFAATLESCIQCGLIQSNTHYDDLLARCTMGIQLTDPDYHSLLTSDFVRPVPEEVMEQTQTGPVQLDGGLRLSGADIHGGHVLWTEDVSELLAVLDDLRDAKKSLEDSNHLLQEEYALKTHEAHVAEQDRLYNRIQCETAVQINLLAKLTDEFEKAESEEKRKKLLGKMIVIGAYLKRRNNLIFLADKTPVLSERELSLTFAESISNLELYGVSCGFQMELSEPVAAAQMMAMYDFFEEVVERSLDSMSAVTVRIGKRMDALAITVNTDADNDFSVLSSNMITARQDEDGEWQISMCLCAGGEA